MYIVSTKKSCKSFIKMVRSALNWKFKDTTFGSNNAMILGNLLHMLFQYAIKNQKYDKNQLNELLIDLLKRKQIINQMYESNLNEEFMLKETLIYLASIEKWLKEHINIPLMNSINGAKCKSFSEKSTKNFHISNVCDIEESIWSTKYGYVNNLLKKSLQRFLRCLRGSSRLRHQTARACAGSAGTDSSTNRPGPVLTGSCRHIPATTGKILAPTGK